jgi:asparagine synthase (glutamine-hydrolysing)
VCGINGAIVLGRSDYRITEPYITTIRDAMAHRGPDGSGVWLSPDGRVGLGHRRLSIIDLSTDANQPMTNEDGSLQVVFNGEIYNHAEIRSELEATGKHRWKTDHSDTEVILHAFEEWGIECLHRFRGMFAIAMWDGRSQELWLIRDRIGIKPLYYSEHHGRLVFASEIKALLKDPDQPRAVNEEGLFHYLSFLTTPAPQTLFEGIRKLPSGSLLRVDREGRIEERRWYELWEHVTPVGEVSEDELCGRILSELRTSVQLRKVSDVPVGVFLSGGIDSSTNVALFSEGATSVVKTFSIGYDGDYDTYKNELTYARMVADRFGAEYHELLLGVDDLLSFLPRMVELQDEPIADPVCVPVYYVSKLARDNGVIVCQVGEGADELFWGYPTWKRKHQLQRAADLPVPNVVKRVVMWMLRAAGKGSSHQYEALRRDVLGQPVFWGGAEAFTDAEKRELLSPRLRKRLSAVTSWDVIRPIHNRFLEQAWEPSTLHWMTYLDLNLRLPELLLMRVDKMSMGVSLEGRVPFLDHKFVELVLGIPERTKIKNGTLKYLLKKAVRGVIPDSVIDRPKQGFGVPVYEWFFERLGTEAHATLKTFCEETDFLSWPAVEKVFQQHGGSQAWCLLNFATWWNTYIRQSQPTQGSATAETG